MVRLFSFQESRVTGKKYVCFVADTTFLWVPRHNTSMDQKEEEQQHQKKFAHPWSPGQPQESKRSNVMEIAPCSRL